MQVVCREDMNTLFWREGNHDDWCWANLDELIEKYEDEPYTELEYWKTVYREDTDKPLYYVFRCKECDHLILTVDIDHGYDYCPHCGRAIWHGIDEERDL